MKEKEREIFLAETEVYGKEAQRLYDEIKSKYPKAILEPIVSECKNGHRIGLLIDYDATVEE